jgi:hypothetical protein
MEMYLANVFLLDDDNLVIALFEQGHNTMDNYNQLTVEDITRICFNIRRPGEMVMDEDG